MGRLISITESQASISNEVASIDEAKFVNFMKELPIWEFASITKVDYLKLNSEEKSSLIYRHYNHMLSLERGSGKFNTFFRF